MDYVMFKADPDADTICDLLISSGMKAYVKHTGLEGTALPLAGLYPVLFVEADKLDEADRIYREWQAASTSEEDEEMQEEKRYAREWKMWVGRILLVFFIGGILFSIISHYIHF